MRPFNFCRLVLPVLLLAATLQTSNGQYFELKGNRKHVDVPFKMVRNLMIVKLRINNNGPYNFILDTGVGYMIITEPKLIDSLKIPDKRTLRLSGLGAGEDYEAYLTAPLNIDIPGINSVGVGAAIFKKDHFGLSNYAGMPIHGLLGYEFFSRLVVKINFTDSTLTAYRPGLLKPPKKYEALPLSIESNKPYITTALRFCDDTTRQCKLVVDIGAGHALLLYDNTAGPWPVDKAIAANLGMGLTGPITGTVSRVTQISLGRYNVGNVLSSFPESQAPRCTQAQHDGNIGMNLLKRFTLIFDYEQNVMYVKPRVNMKDAFEHDMSGIEYYAGGEQLDHVVISRVEPGSASDEVGLMKDDEIMSVNFRPVHTMGLEELDRVFRSGDGRNLLLEIYRDKKYSRVVLTLKRRI